MMSRVTVGDDHRPLIWVGSSRRDLREFPELVQNQMGYALYVAQCGGRHRSAKSLKGFGGAGVVEVIQDFQGDTFRAVYTVRFEEAVYVLHVFQKKSKKGSETPWRDSNLIQQRLREVREIHEERLP